MIILKFLKASLWSTGHFIQGWVASFSYFWTTENIFWSYHQTYFKGKDAKKLRDEYDKEQRKLIKKIK